MNEPSTPQLEESSNRPFPSMSELRGIDWNKKLFDCPSYPEPPDQAKEDPE